MAIIFHLQVCIMAKNCQMGQKGLNQLFPLTELSLREGIGLEGREGDSCSLAYVSRDQVSPLLAIYCSLFLHKLVIVSNQGINT